MVDLSGNTPIKVLAFASVFFTVIVACFVGFKHINKAGQYEVGTYETTDSSTKTETFESLAFDENTKVMSTTSIELTPKDSISTTKENKASKTTKATTKRTTTTKKTVPYTKYIEITSFPSKTVYYIGDSFSTSGLKVKAYYSDNTSKDVSSSVKCSSPNMSSKGTKTVQVEFTDSLGNKKTSSFSITVSAPYVSLSESDLTLSIGDSYYLFAYKSPYSCTTTWHTTSSGIVKVDKYGCVTAVSTGTAAVYATIEYNGITYTSDYCWVTVKSDETTTQPESTLNINDVSWGIHSYNVPSEGEYLGTQTSLSLNLNGYIESDYMLDSVTVGLEGPKYVDGEKRERDQYYTWNYNDINSNTFNLDEHRYSFDVILGETYTFYVIATDASGGYGKISYEVCLA